MFENLIFEREREREMKKFGVVYYKREIEKKRLENYRKRDRR